MKLSRTIPAPVLGVFPDLAPRAIPSTGAKRLLNWLTGVGFVRNRPGTKALGNNPDATRYAIDIHNVAFGDAVVETLYHNKAQTYRYVGGTWTTITGATWTGSDDDRFWSLLAPMGASTVGKLFFNNSVDAIRTWDGTTLVSLGANAVPARYALVGDDARLFTAATVESATTHRQRVRWTTIALTEGDHTAWSATGSGFLNLRNDPFPITGLFKLGGRIFVPKSRALCVLVPTGIPTGAYGYDTIASGKDGGADGVFAPGSLVQFGELVGFLSHRTILLFDGGSYTDILSRRARKTLFSRLNTTVLSRVTSVVDSDNNRLGWGFPLDGGSLPTEIWWYHVDYGDWSHDQFAHTALSIFTNIDTTTVDELTGTVDALAGTVDSLSETAATRAVVAMGRSDGSVEQFDETRADDNGRDVIQAYESPALTLEGGLDVGTQRAPSPQDRLIFDEATIWFQDYGTTYMVRVDVSGDGGVAWTQVGTITVTTGGGTPTMPRSVEGRIQGRIDLGKQCQIRLTNSTPSVLWGFEELAVTLDVLGQKRTTVVAGGVGGPEGGGGGSAGGGGGGKSR